MKEHQLKTLAPYWDALAGEGKTFEVRRDDRGFQKGDILVLRRVELVEKPGSSEKVLRESVCHYTNSHRELRRKITYVLTGGQFGIEPGYVVLGLKKA